jgi:pimeloyl-ACP methyl ester carboxylesterase
MPRSDAPPSIRPPGEAHTFAIANDGTRLFVRSKEATAAAPGAPAPLSSGLRAFLCDGIVCDGFIWKYLWEDLASTLPLTHWHYRGHGRSAPPADPERIDIAQHADDLLAVRRLAGDPECVVIGHSMGTQVALEHYHRHPDKVRGLVLVCGSYGKVTQTFRGVPILEAILPKITDFVLKNPDIARAVWSRIPTEISIKMALRAGDLDPDKVNPEDIKPYITHMVHVDLPMFLKMLRAAGDHTAEGYLADVKVPTLIVAGEKDSFTPASLSEAMAERIPGAELLMVKRGTHVAPLEQHELVNAHIASFIRRLG